MLSILSYACWPSVCSPWRNVHSSPLLIFKLGCLDVKLYEFPMYLDINPLLNIGKYFLPFNRLAIFLTISLLCKNFLLRCSPICLFLLLFPFPETYPNRYLLRLMSKSLLLMFPSTNFRESDLIFKSSINFELIFVSGIRNWSNFTFFACNSQFFQHFFKKISLIFYIKEGRGIES